MKAGTFAERDDFHLSRTNLILDEQGWEELRDMLNELLERVHDLQAESAARLGKSKEAIPVTSRLAIMHYEGAGSG